MSHSLFGPSTPEKSDEAKSHFLTLLSLALAALALWTRKEPLPLWISLVATGLLALGVGYIYFEALGKRFRDYRSRWTLCRSIGLLKPRLLDFLSALGRFVERDRTDSFIRVVEEINQLQPLRERHLTVGDSAHLYTIGRFAGAVRSQVSSIKTGQNLIDAASNAYTVFSDYNSFVGQVYNRLLQVVQELSQSKAAGTDRRAEDEAIRAIRTKWNSFRDRQNAHVQTCLQFGEELRRHTDQVSWGTYIEHYQTLE
jgi:hypothetical protein